MVRHDPSLVEALSARGVQIHAPHAVVLCDLDPERFEADVEIYPGVTLCGRETSLGAGTRLGRCGGGFFERVQTGRGVELYGGFFQDAVFLDGVTVRGHAEMRGGTLMEEGSEAAHHVGYKMTITLPYVVAGSLINLCDVLIAGGRSRRDHTEIGSCLALYNFTPWGDKFASRFGDVPRGVFVRSPRIFIGGQTQIVSPVHIGYGATIPAGCGVRKDVPDGRLYGETTRSFDGVLDTSRYGALKAKVMHSAGFIAQLRALRLWYDLVRKACAADDPFLIELYEGACAQIDAGIKERLSRLDKLIARLPASRSAHVESLSTERAAVHRLRIAEHDGLLDGWRGMRATLSTPPEPTQADRETLGAIVRAFWTHQTTRPTSFVSFISSVLDENLVEQGAACLEGYVERATPSWPQTA